MRSLAPGTVGTCCHIRSKAASTAREGMHDTHAIFDTDLFTVRVRRFIVRYTYAKRGRMCAARRINRL